MRQIQDSKTDIIRRYIDQLEVNLLGRVTALDGRVNMDDLLNGRINADYSGSVYSGLKLSG
jgi:hypothetical protein